MVEIKDIGKFSDFPPRKNKERETNNKEQYGYDIEKENKQEVIREIVVERIPDSIKEVLYFLLVNAGIIYNIDSRTFTFNDKGIKYMNSKYLNKVDEFNKAKKAGSMAKVYAVRDEMKLIPQIDDDKFAKSLQETIIHMFPDLPNK